MKYLLIVLFAIVALAAPIHAQVINAASCSQTDVQSAFNSVTNSTTTVNIPTCTGGSIGTWTGQVTATIPSGSSVSVFTIHGNTTVTGACTSTATCTVADNTIIQDNDTADANPILQILLNESNSSEEVRVTGITFQNGTGQTKYNGIVQANGSTDNLRADHNHYVTSSSGSSSIQWQGCLNGVIDHSVFDGGGVSNAVRAYNEGTCQSDSLGVGDQSWTMAPGYGGPKFLFMENNIFNAGASDDCTKGGKYVARFNTYNAETPAPTVQTHPTGGGGRERGCRAQEIYENQMLPAASNYIDTDMWVSSGSARIWGNTTTSSSTGGGTGYDAFIKWIEMRQNNSTYSQGTPPAGWGYCGTAQTGSASNWDSNTGGASGYFCLDGPGAGLGDLLIGGFTFDGSGSNNVENNATGCFYSSSCAWPRQANEQLYEWLDNFSPTPSNPTTFFAAQYSGSTRNVDYYLDCRSGTQSGCTSFTGASTPGSSTNGGVGSGLKAARPSTCTTGVGYWATDEGTWNQSGSGPQGNLYICTATNTWTLSYTPYTYPHPLVSGGSPGANAPTFSPVAGTYGSSQSVTISTTSSGAIICYNTTGSPSTNGTTGCSSGTLYSGAVTVSSSETLYAVAGGTGYSDSSVNSAAYVIGTTASTPTFSPVAGTYSGTQNVTVSSTSSGAVICYTINGTTPATNGTTGCTTGTVYTTPVVVSTSLTVKAIAGGTGYIDSSVGSAAYVINGTAATPTFSPVAGTYTGTQSVAITSSSGGAIICYTSNGATPATNGSTGCTTGTLYSGTVTVSTSETLKAIAGGTGFTDSSVASAAYTINPAVINGVIFSGKTIMSGKVTIQ